MPSSSETDHNLDCPAFRLPLYITTIFSNHTCKNNPLYSPGIWNSPFQLIIVKKKYHEKQKRRKAINNF